VPAPASHHDLKSVRGSQDGAGAGADHAGWGVGPHCRRAHRGLHLSWMARVEMARQVPGMHEGVKAGTVQASERRTTSMLQQWSHLQGLA
jgi:hypothetical protein